MAYIAMIQLEAILKFSILVPNQNLTHILNRDKRCFLKEMKPSRIKSLYYLIVKLNI